MKAKKLKAKRFRYLTGEVVENPMVYLDDFFIEWIEISNWVRDIHLLLNAVACPDLASHSRKEHGYTCKKLIEQVEVAYVIFKQCELPKHPKPLKFFTTRKDLLSFWFDGKYTYNGEVDPADTLRRFFSYQSLACWYETMDNMMVYLADQPVSNEERFGDKIILIREMLLRMAQAMADIQENGGLVLSAPSYVFFSGDDRSGKAGSSKGQKDKQKQSAKVLAGTLDDEQKGTES